MTMAMIPDYCEDFISHLKQEGFDVIFDCVCDGKEYYRVTTPDRRSFTGTIEEIKDFVGEE